jgi:hypothetical protein
MINALQPQIAGHARLSYDDEGSWWLLASSSNDVIHGSRHG